VEKLLFELSELDSRGMPASRSDAEELDAASISDWSKFQDRRRKSVPTSGEDDGAGGDRERGRLLTDEAFVLPVSPEGPFRELLGLPARRDGE
jgi:hypothetical protein